MAYTLAQHAKLEANPLTKFVLVNMLRYIKVMEILPFQNVNSLRTSALRWRVLPGVAFRDLNSDYTEDTSGDLEEVWESLYILGGLVKFDRVLEDGGATIKDPKQLQMEMKLKSLALTWNDYYINGDLATDPLGFQGLKKRISLSPTRQKISAGNSDSVGLNVTNSAANVNLFWTKMEQAYRYTNTGQVDGIFCNEDMLLGFGRSLRYINSAGGNFLDVTKDSFDRAVLNYQGTPIIDMGLKKDQTTEIMANEADGAGSAAVAVSIYFAAFNMEQGIVGVQKGPLQVIPDAKKDVATASQTLIEWVNGLAGFGSYGLARLWNILPPASWTS